MNQVHRPTKPIRSFTLRGGKLTKGQQRALHELWPAYGLSVDELTDELTDERADLQYIFGRSAPTLLEIGFGDGKALLEMAQENPGQNFIGVEVHRPGIGHVLMQIHRHNLTNVKIFCADAIDVLNKAIRDQSLAKICLFFPDPWPKKKHHKRRIVQPPFIDLVANKLEPGGIFHYATDWRDYADEAMGKLESSALVNVAGSGNFSPHPPPRPETKFEKRGRRLGHGVWDIIMQKQKPPNH
ncbi:tRNA (guanosine(46)-N7)-methyltransferase TrmB [Candidatus Spongiihabitans sp.]|uniref:tRNA (guanosine(46)-N7)-methyltransferase TrmB n=1 Tax=Candidatus Spongiihabitans sp. TaxID=3101308 RepID=UPI003C7B19F7